MELDTIFLPPSVAECILISLEMFGACWSGFSQWQPCETQPPSTFRPPVSLLIFHLMSRSRTGARPVHLNTFPGRSIAGCPTCFPTNIPSFCISVVPLNTSGRYTIAMAYTARTFLQREDQIQVFPGAMAICLAYPVRGTHDHHEHLHQRRLTSDQPQIIHQIYQPWPIMNL